MPLYSSDFLVLASSVPNVISPAIAISASRAGHGGLLDLEYADPSAPEVARALQTLSMKARGLWGVKASQSDIAQLTARHGDALAAASLLVLVPEDPVDLAAAVAAARSLSPEARLLVEVLDDALVSELATLSVDGLVAKGHEAGGRVGDDTTFLLVQRLTKLTDLPVFALGGVAPNTAAALKVAGAAGVMLDWPLLGCDEAQAPEGLSRSVLRMDGSETNCLGQDFGAGHRVFWRADHKPARALDALDIPNSDPQAFRAAVRDAITSKPADEALWLVGQDAAFARGLQTRFGSLKAALDGIAASARDLVAQAQNLAPLAPGSALTQTTGTEYPIIQGPMTRVSDVSGFAVAVAEGGALPFLAFALMREAECAALLSETKEKIGDKPLGVGILGFVDDELRAEQTAVITAHKPDFALIAGGRPDQALALEAEGIPTYLHVPSPGLLALFLESGARRFIFEGRECGGHVGPRSSAVLWQQAIDAIEDYYPDGAEIDCELLFAGGVHDAQSGAMVSALAAGLAARGAKIGVVVGTGYILTHEAVATGAVLEKYQELALTSAKTMLLESAPGHATRVVKSPIVDEFFSEKARLRAASVDPDEIKDTLEKFNVGRSRIASKGIDRNPDFGKVDGAEKFVSVDPATQEQLGVYMIGQAASLHSEPMSIAELHAGICSGASDLLAEALPAAPEARVEPMPEGPGARIAITGVGTILPKARDFAAYWENILDAVDAIEEVPERRWDWRRYFDEDRDAPDKIYSKWGGFIDEIDFNPVKYGIPPKTMPSIEPLQLLALETVRQALENAGFKDGVIEDPELRRKTSVIIGVGGGAGPLGQRYAVRSSMPAINGHMTEVADARLPNWTEDSFPGILLNVIAGRVANRFDLGGVNFTVDAACGSSLAAVMMASRELENETSDMVIVGGVDSFQNPFDFVAFSKTRALSPRGKCRTFDASADGIAISEGLAMMVLRRLDEAEASGDRIYAVMRGVAGSSDGKDLSLTAPRAEGQQEALRRAYAHAGISPGTVGAVEAHGTGTVVGDRTEIQSLSKVFAESREDTQFCGVGSVKSMIGHTKAAAGCAGMIKMAMALHHRVLPPTLNVTEPNPSADFPNSPFYVMTETRPWLNTAPTPRRAGVSAFGFGGTNFHVVLEEYTGGYLPKHQAPFRKNWSHELFLFSAESQTDLADNLKRAAAAMAQASREIRPADVAASLAAQFDPGAKARFAIVASSLDDASTRISRAAEGLRGDQTDLRSIDPQGAFFSADEPLTTAEVAFLFPGQGSQYPGMAADLAMTFPQVREDLEGATRSLADRLDQPLSDYIYPRPTLDPSEHDAQIEALKQTFVAQPAIGAVSHAVLNLVRGFGLEASQLAGHSFGEYTALHAASSFDADTLMALAHARGDAIVKAGGDDLGTMAAVNAGPEAVRAALGDLEGVTLANMNAPDQTVIAGPTQAVHAAQQRLADADLSAKLLPVACGFHSDCVAPARDLLASALKKAEIAAPQTAVFANATATPYATAPEDVRAQLTEHLVDPVNFAGSVEAMHDAGARLFFEIGPGAVLSRLTNRILDGKPHLALTADMKGRSGVQQLLCLLAGAATAGLKLDLAQVWAGRETRPLDVKTWNLAVPPHPQRAMLWKLDAANARPIDGETPRRGFAARIEEDPAPVDNAPIEEKAAPSAAAVPSAATPAPSAPAPLHLTTTSPESVRTGASSVPTPQVPAAARSDMSETVMRRHQELMAQFLENNRAIMMNWLQAGGADTQAVIPTAMQPVARPTAQPATAPAPVPVLPMASPEPVVAAQPVAPAVPTPPIVEQPTPTAPAVATEPAPAASAAITEEQARDALLALISDRTGYPIEMLDLDLNLEADLGVDSIKRVEILGALRADLIPDAGESAREKMGPVSRERTVRGIVAKFMEVVAEFATPSDAASPASAAVPVPAASSPSLTAETVTSALLDLIADRTGYPTEMLDLDLNLEADLGVDSIKRVEILGALRGDLLPDAGDAAREKMGPVSRERTVRGIVAKFMDVASEFAPAAATEPAAPAPVAVEASPELSTEIVTAALLDLISDRTGYPTEMLDLDLNLEADLGVDSIKRVEILGALRGDLLPDAGEAAREKMGPVSRERTVRGIVAQFMTVVAEFQPGVPTEAAAPMDGPASPSVDADAWRPRFVMSARPIPADPPKPWVVAGATYVVTDDETGIADAVAAHIEAQGGSVRLLKPSTLDFSDDAALRSAVIEMDGAVAGLLHLAPLAQACSFMEMSRAEWRASVDTTTRAFYTLLNALGEGLSIRDDGLVLCATRMGGAFGFDGTVPVDPAAGGAPGLLKTVAKEWTSVHCRAVDFASATTVQTCASEVIAEAGRPGPETEVGFLEGARHGLFAEPVPIGADSSVVQDIEPGAIVLVTGGARGITAKIARHLAELHKPHFILAGSTNPPTGDEAAATAGINDPRALKAALIAETKAAGGAVTPASIEAAFNTLLKARDIRNALASIDEAGATAEYVACDVRDQDALEALVSGLYDRFDRIDGVIHGAGVIEDKLVLDKTVESFDNVTRTKTESAFALSRALRPETLKFLVFFTSVAGRFGNRGQGDYGAANETVSKLARVLDAQWAGRVTAISWGPWDSGGMVSPEIKAQFDAMKIEPIDPYLGVRALEFEITRGDEAASEVVWGRGPWEDDAEAYAAAYGAGGTREAAE
ncbi:SDR family NAD(P)-dependent oxidoreductase [Dinoroseobacter sp. S76]|uniref:SDR family NAD(P)-dependent oxidoreductase n=1 Tax=Dinoroseobacter sp. S76 TaxID=3415124 RepID=UPI003C7D8A02